MIMSVVLINVLSMNSFNFIYTIPFICRPQITPSQSQVKAGYRAVKGFGLMSAEVLNKFACLPPSHKNEQESND